jgi:hypothetical protein
MDKFEKVFNNLFDAIAYLEGIKIPDGVIANRKTLGFYFDSCSGAIVWGKEKEIEYAYCLTYHRFTGDLFYRLNEKGDVWENEFPDDEIKAQPEQMSALFPHFLRCNDIIDNIVQPKLEKMRQGELEIDVTTGHWQWWDIIENEK